jgi:hypothetical protein
MQESNSASAVIKSVDATMEQWAGFVAGSASTCAHDRGPSFLDRISVMVSQHGE